MAITVDTTSGGNNDTLSSNTLTWSHTVNSGSDRALFVCIGQSRLSYVTNVTFNGVQLRNIHGAKYTTSGAAIYYLIAPDVGTFNITVTYNTTLQYYRAGAVSMFGVDQITPFLTRNLSRGTIQNKTISINTKVDNSMLIECFGDVGVTNTPASGQTYIDNGTNRSSAYFQTTTAGLYTLNWTGNLSRDYSHVIAEIQPVNTNPAKTFDKVRYVRDWCGGSTANFGNHRVEVQALEGATNRAAGKTPITGLGVNTTSYPVTRVTDGDTNSANYFDGFHGLPHALDIDLGAEYAIDTVKVWHYYTDSRTYYDTKVEVSQDGINWFTAFDKNISNTYAETSAGRSYAVPYPKDIPLLDGIRYIRDYINGSTANAGNHWVEIEAKEGSTNRASGILATSSGTDNNMVVVTDGNKAAAAGTYAYTTETGLQYCQIDLGALYNIDAINIWHYWADLRSYYSTKTQVSADGVTWYDVYNSDSQGIYQETSAGVYRLINYYIPPAPPNLGGLFLIF